MISRLVDIVRDRRKKALDDFVGATPDDWADYKYRRGVYEGTLQTLQNILEDYKEKEDN